MPLTNHEPPVYASLLRRYQALVLDGIIYIAAFTLALFLPALLGVGSTSSRVAMASFIAFFLLYDPLLVGLRGGTIGHFRYHIRVVDANTSEPIGVARAFARAVTKGLLGLLSLIFMLITSRAQSLHDLLVRSIVIPTDPVHATGLDVIAPVALPETGMPSRLRRIVTILVYSILTLVILSLGGQALISPECLTFNACATSDRLVSDAVGLLWVIATAFVLVYGWRGLLFGCRRQRLDTRIVG
jgi:uncharacterized RDD family membrane protein YckC